MQEKAEGILYTANRIHMARKIVTQGKERLRSVYDRACGSGSLLLRAKREVQDVDMI